MTYGKTLRIAALDAALAAVAALALMGGKASADHVSVGIGINLGAPPPPPPVVVVEAPAPVVAVSYDSYVVGYRKNLYDADWRLRLAQADEIKAQRDLDGWRQREGEIAVVVDEREAGLNALKGRLAAGAGNVAELRVRMSALEKRLQNAREDVDAARVLHDSRGVADAEHRFHENEAAAAATAEELRRAQDAAGLEDQIRAGEGDLLKIRADFESAHDGVFSARERLTAAHDAVCLALHDRDESLWLVYRDDIVLGRVQPEAVGFRIDLAVFGGHMPRDPAVLHAHFVRDVGYWRERPVEIQTRVVEVDRVTEISRIRTVQRTHEVARITEVETFEASVTIEQRRAVAERVVVEKQRFEVERVERKTAVAEGRKPRIDPKEAAEAKAIVINAKADAKASTIKAQADAQATRAEARSGRDASKADAKASTIKAQADAQATRADARGGRDQAKADAKSTTIKAQADAQATRADARGGRDQAQADAKATTIKAKADGKSQVTQAQGEAKAKEVQARADSKTQPKTGSANVGDPRTPAKDPRQATAKGAPKGKNDPRKGQSQASTDDPNYRR